MAAREQERASDIHAEAKDRDQGRVAKATRTGQIARRKFSLPSESLVQSQKSAAVYRNNVTDDQHNAGLTIMQCSMVTRPRLASPQQHGVVRHAQPVHLACRIWRKTTEKE